VLLVNPKSADVNNAVAPLTSLTFIAPLESLVPLKVPSTRKITKILLVVALGVIEAVKPVVAKVVEVEVATVP
jgi:hypothetical protein